MSTSSNGNVKNTEMVCSLECNLIELKQSSFTKNTIDAAPGTCITGEGKELLQQESKQLDGQSVMVTNQKVKAAKAVVTQETKY